MNHSLRETIDNLYKRKIEFKRMQVETKKENELLHEEYIKEKQYYKEKLIKINKKKECLKNSNIGINIVHRNNMQGHECELKEIRNKSIELLELEKNIIDDKGSQRIYKKSIYSEELLKYPTWDASAVNFIYKILDERR